MKNKDILKDYDLDEIINKEIKESERPFLQLEIPVYHEEKKDYIEEPKRVIIIEL